VIPRLLLGLPLLVVLISFALSNRAPIRLGLWPTDFTVEVPVSLAILAAGGVAFFLGGLLVWFGALRERQRARQAEHALRLLTEEVQALKARLPAGDMLPPAA
jgi:uncharacterized integral membrane protein